MARLLLVTLLAAACRLLSPEEQLLTRFFEASRLHDTTAVAQLSSVPFNPRTDGVVDAFDVETVEGGATARRVTVRARLRQWNGQLVSRRLAITIRRDDARWRIAAIEEAP